MGVSDDDTVYRRGSDDDDARRTHPYVQRTAAGRGLRRNVDSARLSSSIRQWIRTD